MIDKNNGAYLDASLSGHVFDVTLAEAIKDFFKNENCNHIADFGCGPGWYTNVINSLKDIKCDGYDANPYTLELARQNNFIGNFYIKDLTQNLETTINTKNSNV